MGVTGSHSHLNYRMVVVLIGTLVHKRKSSKKVAYWTAEMNHMYSCVCTDDNISIFITLIDKQKF